MNLVYIGATIAVLSTFAAWAFFRKPGVKFWTVAPAWRGNEYLTSLGAALWLYGCIFGLVLVAAHFITQYV